ncbi:MAG TPA: DUF2252 domain-containing protein [Casimicrobiaceae bacterium]|nr:DUF2252 domain-containing protein [Casimicrobiaceae bacterium]
MKFGMGTSRIERRKHGKSLREKCPRSVHAEWKPRPKSVDPINWLEECDTDRIPALIPLKYQRMAESPFKFFRGAAIIQARDLARSQVSGIIVQACGDCHLLNFGGFASPERQLTFDINDFDETFPGPWEWDMKRLGASLVLAARDLRFSKAVADKAVRAAAASYREKISAYAEMSVLDTWYAQITIDAIKQRFRGNPAAAARLLQVEKQARSQSSEAVFPKLTTVVDGRLRIKDNPPVLFHPQMDAAEWERLGAHAIKQYRDSLRQSLLTLLDRYRFVDGAVKVVGVGSVGTRCFLALFVAEDGEPLFLQIKEARRSVLESPRGKSRYAHQGFRVVYGQRLTQAATDIFLGWFRTPTGHDYYVRQFRDRKVSIELETFQPSTLVAYATLCGWGLARAHAKVSDAATIAGYLGSNDRFDTALATYSEAYANQAERDFELFQAAIRHGRLKTEPEKGVDLGFIS